MPVQIGRSIGDREEMRSGIWPRNASPAFSVGVAKSCAAKRQKGAREDGWRRLCEAVRSEIQGVERIVPDCSPIPEGQLRALQRDCQ